MVAGQADGRLIFPITTTVSVNSAVILDLSVVRTQMARRMERAVFHMRMSGVIITIVEAMRVMPMSVTGVRMTCVICASVVRWSSSVRMHPV